MADLGALGEAVQRVREEQFSDVPAALVDAILAIETESYEDRLTARNRVAAALGEHLKNADPA